MSSLRAMFFVLDVSYSRSKQLIQPAGQSIPPAKLASIQAQVATSSDKGDAGSHKEGSSGSSPRSEGASRTVLIDNRY